MLSSDGRGLGIDKGDKALQEINTHERECALRYERIEERLKDGLSVLIVWMKRLTASVTGCGGSLA